VRKFRPTSVPPFATAQCHPLLIPMEEGSSFRFFPPDDRRRAFFLPLSPVGFFFFWGVFFGGLTVLGAAMPLSSIPPPPSWCMLTPLSRVSRLLCASTLCLAQATSLPRPTRRPRPYFLSLRAGQRFPPMLRHAPFFSPFNHHPLPPGFFS